MKRMKKKKKCKKRKMNKIACEIVLLLLSLPVNVLLSDILEN